MHNDANTLGAYALQAAVLIVGIGLVLAGFKLGWGMRAWLSGIFFINIFVQTALLSLAQIPGFWQPILSNPWVGLFQIASILILLLAVAVVGLLYSLGILHDR